MSSFVTFLTLCVPRFLKLCDDLSVYVKHKAHRVTKTLTNIVITMC